MREELLQLGQRLLAALHVLRRFRLDDLATSLGFVREGIQRGLRSFGTSSMLTLGSTICYFLIVLAGSENRKKYVGERLPPPCEVCTLIT